MQHIL